MNGRDKLIHDLIVDKMTMKNRMLVNSTVCAAYCYMESRGVVKNENDLKDKSFNQRATQLCSLVSASVHGNREYNSKLYNHLKLVFKHMNYESLADTDASCEDAETDWNFIPDLMMSDPDLIRVALDPSVPKSVADLFNMNAGESMRLKDFVGGHFHVLKTGIVANKFTEVLYDCQAKGYVASTAGEMSTDGVKEGSTILAQAIMLSLILAYGKVTVRAKHFTVNVDMDTFAAMASVPELSSATSRDILIIGDKGTFDDYVGRFKTADTATDNQCVSHVRIGDFNAFRIEPGLSPQVMRFASAFVKRNIKLQHRSPDRFTIVYPGEISNSDSRILEEMFPQSAAGRADTPEEFEMLRKYATLDLVDPGIRKMMMDLVVASKNNTYTMDREIVSYLEPVQTVDIHADKDLEASDMDEIVKVQ